MSLTAHSGDVYTASMITPMPQAVNVTVDATHIYWTDKTAIGKVVRP